MKDKASKRDQAYEKPAVTRIDLALEETLSSGCKVDGTVCADSSDPFFVGTNEAGS